MTPTTLYVCRRPAVSLTLISLVLLPPHAPTAVISLVVIPREIMGRPVERRLPGVGQRLVELGPEVLPRLTLRQVQYLQE